MAETHEMAWSDRYVVEVRPASDRDGLYWEAQHNGTFVGCGHASVIDRALMDAAEHVGIVQRTLPEGGSQ